ncbi:MAG: tmoS 1, partial [Planctomycetaceae bacterium]|nr:tmoS 1 [Planctomycetaceae bacterium]
MSADVTNNTPTELELAEVNQQLVSQIADLKTQLRRKDDFLAMLAHELRNPLAPISNSLQIMALSRDAGPAVAEVRAIMQRQVQLLVRLVDDVQEVARMMRGTVELRQTRISLETILKNALQSVRPLIDAANHRLTYSVSNEPMILNADSARLAQVFSNLLVNAVKYSPAGSAIWLAGQREGDQAVISIRDAGSGIPPEDLLRIFDLFNQSDSAERRSRGGLGVGLTVAKCIVEMHGGQIEAHSAGRGMGSEFIVRLPIAPTAPEPVSAMPSRPTTEVESSRPPHDSVIIAKAPAPAANAHVIAHRILVVDDIKSAAYVLSKLLQALGQQVQTAESAEAALAMARQTPPDIII